MRMYFSVAVASLFVAVHGENSLPDPAACLSDGELAQAVDEAKRALEAAKYSVTTQGRVGPLDFAFAPSNYTTAGVNPSSRYIVPRLGPWREGDIGGDSFLNWGIGEVDTLTSRQVLLSFMHSSLSIPVECKSFHTQKSYHTWRR